MTTHYKECRTCGHRAAGETVCDVCHNPGDHCIEIRVGYSFYEDSESKRWDLCSAECLTVGLREAFVWLDEVTYHHNLTIDIKISGREEAAELLAALTGTTP